MTALKKSPDKQANKCWVIVRFERAGHAVLFFKFRVLLIETTHCSFVRHTMFY